MDKQIVVNAFQNGEITLLECAQILGLESVPCASQCWSNTISRTMLSAFGIDTSLMDLDFALQDVPIHIFREDRLMQS